MFEALFGLLYLLLLVGFLALMRALDLPLPTSIGSQDLLLLCLATFRLTELVTYDRITRFLRDPFIRRVEIRKDDGTQEEEVEPAGSGLRRVVGELLICPWCTGIWAATGLTYFWVLAPGPARVLMLALGVAGGGILLELIAKLLDQVIHRAE
ncbi:MAG TPA: DUF1360 domain-containing protein [Armatimonadota bacterium]|jgi:hypothetical protein